ncbi:MAG: protein phosphatase 2C domain-containing protein [Nitrospirota bacterium]
MLNQRNIHKTSLSLTIWLEKIPGQGEDALPINVQVSKTVSLLGVFDGMGGRSPKGWKNKKGRVHSGAYYASRIAKDTVADHFLSLTRKNDHKLNDTAYMSESFSEVIFLKLKMIADKYIGIPSLRGTLFSRLATTAAFAVTEHTGNKVSVDQFWIGDSRIYLLSPESGLSQLTRDDTRGERQDSSHLFINDLPLSKYLNGDKKFPLNHNRLEFELPCVVFVSTDGCYGYSRSPMDFEHQILDSLIKSSDLISWGKNMENIFREIAGDDVSMSLTALGWKEFDEMKNSFRDRLTFLEVNFIGPLNNFYQEGNDEMIKSLWSVYQLPYEKHLRDDDIPEGPGTNG